MEEQGAIVTLQSRGKNSCGDVLLRPDTWEVNLSEVTLKRLWKEVAEAGWDAVEAWTWLFSPLHQPCWVKAQQVLVQSAQGQ